MNFACIYQIISARTQGHVNDYTTDGEDDDSVENQAVEAEPVRFLRPFFLSNCTSDELSSPFFSNRIS
jgi:hypothetical protein